MSNTTDRIKMSESDKEYFLELAKDHEIITAEDVDKFETLYTEMDKKIIDEKKHRLAWWSLHKDAGGVARLFNKYPKLIEKHEKLICERIKKRIKNR